MASFNSPRQNRSLTDRAATAESGNPTRAKSAPFTVPRTGASAKLSEAERSALAATRKRLEFDSESDADGLERRAVPTSSRQAAKSNERQAAEERQSAQDEDELTVSTLLTRLKQVRAYISEADSMLRDTKTVEAAQVGGGSRELRERRTQIERLLTSLREQEANYVWLLGELESRAQQAVRRGVLQRVNAAAIDRRRAGEESASEHDRDDGGDGEEVEEEEEEEENEPQVRRDGSGERNASESDSSSTEIDERSLNAYTRPKIEGRIGLDSPHKRSNEVPAGAADGDASSKLRELREHLASLEQRKAQVDTLLEKFGGLGLQGELLRSVTEQMTRREEPSASAPPPPDTKRSAPAPAPARAAPVPAPPQEEEVGRQELMAMTRQLGSMRVEADEVRSKLHQLTAVRERLAQMQSLLSNYDEQTRALTAEPQEAAAKQSVLVARPSAARQPLELSPSGGSSATVTTVDGDGDGDSDTQARRRRPTDEQIDEIDMARLDENVQAAMAHLAASRRERAAQEQKQAPVQTRVNEASATKGVLKSLPVEDDEDEEEDDEEDESDQEEEEDEDGTQGDEPADRVRLLESKLAKLNAAKQRLERLQRLADCIQQLRSAPTANATGADANDDDLVEQLAGEPELAELASELLERGQRERERELEHHDEPQPASEQPRGAVRDEADSLRKLIEEREQLLSMQRRLAELNSLLPKSSQRDDAVPTTRDAADSASAQRAALNGAQAGSGSVKFQEPSAADSAAGTAAERTLITENDVVYNRIRAGKQNAILKSALKQSASGSGNAPATNGGLEERADSDAAPTSTIDMTTIATWGGSSAVSSTDEPLPASSQTARAAELAADVNSPRSNILNNLSAQLASTTALCATLARGQERLHSMLSTLIPDRAASSLSDAQPAVPSSQLAATGSLQTQTNSMAQMASAQLSLSVTQCQQTLLYQHTEIQQLKQAVGVLLNRQGFSFGPTLQQLGTASSQHGPLVTASSELSLLSPSAAPRVQTPSSAEAFARSPSTGARNEPRVEVQPELSAQEQAVFEVLRDRIYSEVGALISQNESTPQYLLQLFRELQLLSNDEQRLAVLRAVRDCAVAGVSNQARLDSPSTSNTTPKSRPTASAQTRPVRGHDSSARVAESDDAPIPAWRQRQVKSNPAKVKEEQAASKPKSASARASTDTRKAAEPAPRRPTNRSDSFANELESASASDLDARAGAALRGAHADESDSQDEPLEAGSDSIMRFIRDIGRQLAETLGRLTSTTVDAVAAQLKTFVINKLEASAFCALLPTAEASGAAGSSMRQRDVETAALTRFFVSQLDTALSNAIGKYHGKRVRDCCEDMLVDVADVLYTELNFFKLMQNLETADASPAPLLERTAPRS